MKETLSGIVLFVLCYGEKRWRATVEGTFEVR
jgi:hypothetical protein